MNLSCRTGLMRLPMEPKQSSFKVDSGADGVLSRDSGKDCYDAIVNMDAQAFGASLSLNMKCWETLLPHVVRHPLIRVDLVALLQAYQRRYLGAMYSGCGGGYLIVVANEPVPGAFKVQVRTAKP